VDNFFSPDPEKHYWGEQENKKFVTLQNKLLGYKEKIC